MNFFKLSSVQEKLEPGTMVSEDNPLNEAANDPDYRAFFERFAGRLAGTRAILENYHGTEKEGDDLRENLTEFSSSLKELDGRINEAEDKGDFTLSKSFKALRTSLKFEVGEINNKLTQE